MENSNEKESNRAIKVTLRALIAFAIIVVNMVLIITTVNGCEKGDTFNTNGWTLFRYMDGKVVRVNIVSANSDALVEDGVLNIPAKIGKYKISGFGRPSPFSFSAPDTYFSFADNLTVNRIVVAEELRVDHFFWTRNGRGDSWECVEFLSSDFSNIKDVFMPENIGLTYIIPDGSMDNFIQKFGDTSLSYFTVLEKTEFLQGGIS